MFPVVQSWKQWRAPLSSQSFTAALTKLFAWVLFAFGVLTVILTVRIVIRTYSPVLFWDQWQIIHTLMQSGGHPGLQHLWAQHNEHRLLTGRLFGFADLFFFRGRNVSLFAAILFFQFCHLLLFALVLRRFSRLPGPVYLSLLGFLAYCLFSPLQIENFDWAFQIVFILTSFSATACFAAALWYYQRTFANHRPHRLFILALSLLAAFISEGSEAHGLLAWPVLLFLVFALRLPARDRYITAAVSVACIAAYLIRYESPDPPFAMTRAVSHPLDLLKFVLTYLGNSWDAHLPNESRWPTVSESLSFLAIAATLACAVQSLRRSRLFSPLQIFFVSNLLFGLGTATMTAVGRLRFGVSMALMSRYQTPALVFWGSLAAFLALAIDWTVPRRLLIAQTLLLVLMLAEAGRWAQAAQSAATRQYQLEEAWNAVVQDRFNDPAATRLFYSLDMLKEFVPYLRRHHWGPAGEISTFVKMQRTGRSPQLEGHRILPQACLGRIDEARRSGLTSVFLRGWAFQPMNRQPGSRIALATDTGKIIGYADLNIDRPDVSSQYPEAQHLKTGWSANINVSADGVYRAFLLFGNSPSACALQTELRIQNHPDF